MNGHNSIGTLNYRMIDKGGMFGMVNPAILITLRGTLHLDPDILPAGAFILVGNLLSYSRLSL